MTHLGPAASLPARNSTSSCSHLIRKSPPTSCLWQDLSGSTLSLQSLLCCLISSETKNPREKFKNLLTLYPQWQLAMELWLFCTTLFLLSSHQWGKGNVGVPAMLWMIYHQPATWNYPRAAPSPPFSWGFLPPSLHSRISGGVKLGFKNT